MNQEPAPAAASANAGLAVTGDTRLDRLRAWAADCLDQPILDITRASEDASFRRYFRLHLADKSCIVMDAPPEKEDCRPFVDITQRLLACGVQAPRISAANLKEGFLLLADLGHVTYHSQLDEMHAEGLYADAFATLLRMQTAETTGLPPYDRTALRREMLLFREWFLERQLGLRLEPAQAAVIEAAFEALTQAALEQPRCFVHRDYHSRNLMVTEQANPGVLDYQDAVLGPVTYDLMSLLRDAYIAWPRERVQAWVLDFAAQAQSRGLWPAVPDAQVMRWFDLMGAQRFLKVIGIFCRLYLRDGKSRYLADIPRVFAYLMDVLPRYPETRALHTLILSLHIERRL